MPGSLILKNTRLLGTLNTCAISRMLGSSPRIAAYEPDQTMGVTVKSEIKTGTISVFIRTSAKIINEATGTARMSRSTGEKSRSKRRFSLAAMPPKKPMATPAAKPASTLKSDKRQLR